MQRSLNTSRYSVELTLGNGTEKLPVTIRKHASARRMVIRYQPLTHSVSLTLPRYAGIRQGLRFIEEKRGWIAQQVMQYSKRVSFADGQAIPVLGKRYTIRHAPGRGVVRIEGETLLVPGDAEFLPRRVGEWLKRTAREEMTKLSHDKAQQIGRKVARISLRDTSSRWGSCSHEGNLSYSWRLIFAPYEVLEYIVCHEVAHLEQLNHSPAFWAVVEKLCPEYEKAWRWLKKHGGELYNYG